MLPFHAVQPLLTVKVVVNCIRGGKTMKIIGTTTKRRMSKAMWVRITSFALTLALGGSLALGIPLHFGDSDCSSAEMRLSGCERMGMQPTGPGVTATALCCLLDCQQPGPTGNAFNLRLPKLSVISVHHCAMTMPATLVRRFSQEKRLQSSSFAPNTYLKNLALLI